MSQEVINEVIDTDEMSFGQVWKKLESEFGPSNEIVIKRLMQLWDIAICSTDWIVDWLSQRSLSLQFRSGMLLIKLFITWAFFFTHC